MKEQASPAGCARVIGGRKEQQDAVACFASRDRQAYFLVLADGMGGHSGGALAAQTVIEIAGRLWAKRRSGPPDPASFLAEFVTQADRAVHEGGRASGLAPRSTLVALLTDGEQACWAHVGDSRLYAFRDGQQIFRTEDHTAVQAMVRAGKLDEDAMYTHPDQHKLLRGLGGDTPVQPTHGRLQLSGETGFLLCSDGFWSQIAPQEMIGILREPDLQKASEHACALAARRGGEDGDNVSVALLRTLPMRRWRLWPLAAALALAGMMLLWRLNLE